MKILVAGGSGFIGSHLTDRLVSEGHSVDVIDNLVTGQRENIAHLVEKNQIEFIEADICDKKNIPRKDYDRIYNLASPASPVDFKRVPLEILFTGAIGQKNMLEVAQEVGSRIFFASTSEVYGDPLVNPQPESYFGNVNTIGERACYDEAKRFAEALTTTFSRQHNVETRIVRIFNTYGPRMRPDDGRVIPNFFMQALKGESLTVYGDGQQTRSLCHVSDMVSGFLKLMESDIDTPVNVGNTIEMTILQIADKINELTGNKAENTFLPLPQNDPKVRRPDTTKAKELLNWEPQMLLDDGLRETMDYFKKSL